MKYEIKGGNLPAVVCTMQEGERIIADSGAMSWMSGNMAMETQASGGLEGAIGRFFAKEHIFQNTYTAEGGQGMIAFSSKMPGEIRPVRITPGQGLIIQKGAFLASETGVRMEAHIQGSLAKGWFGGEGFVLSRLSGEGTAFLEIDGSAVEYSLGEGQEIVISTGCLAAMDATCRMDVKAVDGLANALFGGESLFNTAVKGPGKVLLQTMPAEDMAAALMPYTSQRRRFGF